MDLNALRIFCEVVRLKSFSQAARQLNVPSSNVSRKIQSLESELGVKLVHRTTRSVTPTSDGKKVHELAQGLLESNHNIKEWILGQTTEARGLLRITSPETFAQWPLGEWLIQFQREFPNVEIELITDSSNLSFDDFELDFAFRSGPLPSSNLIAKELFTIQFGFFAAKGFLDRHPQPQSLEELKALPAIGCTAEQSLLPWFYQEQGQQHFWLPQTRFRVKDQSIALKAAQEELGIVFLPISLVNMESEYEPLLPLLKQHWPQPVPFHILYRDRESANSARYKAFLSFINQRIAETRGSEEIEGVSYR